MAQKIGLFIKGTTKKSATRAAQRHGVPVRNCKMNPRGDGVLCDAPCSSKSSVVKWYTEKANRVKPGRGFVPGTLLFYGGCPSGGGLSGARKRRRKR